MGFRIDGAQASVDDQGNLVLTTPDGNQLVEAAPALSQTSADGVRTAVVGGYQIRQDGSIGFSVGQYDPSRELLIDPPLNYTGTLGGLTTATGVTTDRAGNVYVVGYTQSLIFPTTVGAYDRTLDSPQAAFAVKLGAAGTIVWATYLGGSTSLAGDAAANAVALSPDGHVYLTGYTNSTDFPTTAGAYQTALGTGMGTATQDAFLSELSPDGSSLAYSTFLGGNKTDTGTGVAVDRNTGQAVVVGSTQSTNFPTQNAVQSTLTGTQAGFVTRFTGNGSGLVFSTYWGGGTADAASGVAIDSVGQAVVVGNGGIASSIARFTQTGQIKSSGSPGNLNGVAIDGQDRVYVTGPSFTARFDSLGFNSTNYTIGSGGNAIAVDAQGRPVVVGTSGSSMSVTRYLADGSGVDWSTTVASSSGLGVGTDRFGNIYPVGIGSGGSGGVWDFWTTARPGHHDHDHRHRCFILRPYYLHHHPHFLRNRGRRSPHHPLRPECHRFRTLGCRYRDGHRRHLVDHRPLGTRRWVLHLHRDCYCFGC